MATGAQAKGFRFELTGVKEMMKALELLPTIAMQKTVVRNALKKSLEPTAQVARANIPKKTGNLQKSITVSSTLKKSQKQGPRDRSAVYMWVGSSAPHAHLIEFGTKDRVKKTPSSFMFPGGEFAITQDTGRMTRNPFMRRAWDATNGMALKIFTEQMRIQLARATKRVRNKVFKGKLSLTAKQSAGLGI